MLKAFVPLIFVGKFLFRCSLVILLVSTFAQSFVPLGTTRIGVRHQPSILYPINTGHHTRAVVMNTRWQKALQLKITSKRRSVSNIQVMSLFGLGGLEIAVICLGVGIVLGPEKIGEILRSTGKTAREYKDELSKVPEEFQKGYEEGQIDSRSRKAKQMLLEDSNELNDKTDTEAS